VWQNLPAFFLSKTMALSAGTHLGPYEIQSALGAGGMGEVYRARDTRLERDVAIKVLPAAFSSDPDRLRRFEQEARAAAALNHPNILAVHDIGIHEGAPFIVMELLEGGTLRERLTAAGLPVRRAVEYATQIARGLAAAHEKGIVHRDLKPENVFVTADGRVKILDFGLAKLTAAEPVLAGVSELPTLSPPTTPGVVLGTVGYMAPEQVRGEVADHRADIFALGGMLYEMIAGRRAFHAATTAETMTAILKEDPPELPLERLPPALGRIVRRCLEKNPAARFKSADDLAFALEAIETQSGAAASRRERTVVSVRGRERVAWAVAAVAVVAASAVLWLRAPVTQPAPLVTRFDVLAPPTESAASLAVSPDGSQLAYVATMEGQSRLWVRPLSDTNARVLPGTEGASFPFWAPDGRAIGFFAEGKLKRVDLAGGTPQVLADAPGGRGGTWNSEGVILFTPANFPSLPGSVLMRVSAAGGTPVPVTRLAAGDGSHRWPQFLPDGRRFIFFSTLGRADAQGVYVGSLDGGEPIRVLEGDSPAMFAPPDQLLLVRGDALMAVRFDPTAGAAEGEPRRLAQPVGRDMGSLAAAFSVSAETLAYRATGGSQRRQLVWIDRAGTMLGTVGPPDDNGLAGLALDSAGQRIAVGRAVLGNFDVWLAEVSRGVLTRFTFDPAPEALPVWSHDGQLVFFLSARQGPNGLAAKPTSGAGGEQVVADQAGAPLLSSSPDGKFLLYSRTDPNTAADLWAVPLTGDRKAFAVIQAALDQPGGEFSPDGRWVVYESNESGQFEVYVQPFPAAGGKWQISTAGGRQARWRRDGKELFYVAPDGRLMAVPLAARADGKTLDAGVPAPLFRTRLATGANVVAGRPEYAVAPDGRFLMNTVVEDTAASPITVIVNWAATLEAR
jgi:Tol biopolymer transport system component